MKTETKATHTPGPWRIGDAGRTVFGAKVPRSMPATVAYMPPITPRVDAGERRANRNLIAAAPELLAACELLLGRLDEDEDRNAKWIGDTARAAIAAAKGDA